MILEFSVRFLNLAPQLYWINTKSNTSSFELDPNPLLGYRMKKNEKNQQFNLHESFPITNTEGFRDYNRKIEKSAKRRILLLGDSIVAGHGLENIDNLIGPQLEVNLECNDVEVISIGIGGYSFIGESELLKIYSEIYKPDDVIQIIVNNDFKNNNTMIHTVSFQGSLDFFRTLIVESHLIRIIMIPIKFLQQRYFPYYEQAINHISKIESYEPVHAFEENRRLKSRWGFTYLAFLWPEFSDDKVFEFSSKKHVQSKLAKLRESADISFVSLHSLFQQELRAKILKNPRETFTIGDGMHPNIRGTSLAAKEISRVYIEKNRLIPCL